MHSPFRIIYGCVEFLSGLEQGHIKKSTVREAWHNQSSVLLLYNWIMEWRVWRDSEGTGSKSKSTREVQDKTLSFKLLGNHPLLPALVFTVAWLPQRFPVEIASCVAFKGTSSTSWGVWNRLAQKVFRNFSQFYLTGGWIIPLHDPFILSIAMKSPLDCLVLLIWQLSSWIKNAVYWTWYFGHIIFHLIHCLIILLHCCHHIILCYIESLYISKMFSFSSWNTLFVV